MVLKKENLRFREIEYPQLKRLPKGVRLVKQVGRTDVCSVRAYSAFTKDGTLIGTDLGKSKRSAKLSALMILNHKLRQVALIYEKPTPEQFERAVA